MYKKQMKAQTLICSMNTNRESIAYQSLCLYRFVARGPLTETEYIFEWIK